MSAVGLFWGYTQLEGRMMVWSSLLINERSINKNIFYAVVQVKGTGGSGGGSSTKSYFHHFVAVLFTGPVIDCVFQHPSLSHVYSFNGI